MTPHKFYNVTREGAGGGRNAQPPQDVEFVAQCEKSVQITESKWTVETPTLALTESTKIEEIYRWYRRHLPQGHMEIKIIQLQK
jgi:hypothetical protein